MPRRTFCIISSGQTLMNSFDPEHDEVYFFDRGLNEPDKLDAVLKEYQRTRPALGQIELDGHRTSDPLLIALVSKHRLLADDDDTWKGMYVSEGFKAFLYPKAASPGVDEEPFNTFVGFDAHRYVFNKLQQTQPDSPLLLEAARFEKAARGSGSH
ncbi:g1216 [Coccomyxa elongata]